MKSLRSLDSKKGQATIEYLLMILLVLGMTALITGLIARTRNNIWSTMTCEIAAPCAGCPLEGDNVQAVKAAVNSAGGNCR